MLFKKRPIFLLIVSFIVALALAACGPMAEPASEQAAEQMVEADHHDADDHHDDDDHHHDENYHHDDDDYDHDHDHDLAMLALPELAPVALDGGKLRVVATTSIIGDVVAQVGGDAIELTVLMGPGQDPHSYEPAARDLTAVAGAHVVFINGWDLEEALIDRLKNVAEGVPLIPVSANITPLQFDDDHGHDHDHSHDGPDPHTWFDPYNVVQWVKNIEHVLHDLDRDNEEVYEANTKAYLAELEELIAFIEEQVATIPVEKRVLVTNHDTLGYFAARYDFEIFGAILPGGSTLAEPSAADLAALVTEMRAEGICTIFAETVAPDQLIQAVARELDTCDEVKIVTLYTDAIGPAGSGADSYIGMMRANIDAIVAGLR